MRVVLDIECNALENPTEIWCICVHDIDTGEKHEFIHGTFQAFQRQSQSYKQIIGHNLIAYDLVAIDRVLGIKLDPRLALDTLILSHLFHYAIPGGHSLEAWGERLKHAKIGLTITDWSSYHRDMLLRCRNDVALNVKLYEFLRKKLDRKEFYQAIKVEHEAAIICADMRCNGFKFDYDRALELDTELRTRLTALEAELQEAFPPKIKITELKTKTKVEHIPFNPASPSQIVERLNEAGWKPTNRTATGKSFKVDETNLATLPDEAPRAAHRLVEYLLLIARVRTLKQWFDAYDKRTRRIHGITRSLGTYTHRASHTNPNTGNIAAEKSIKYQGKYLKDLATELGGKFRSFWIAPEDKVLVGTDAEGIQLRMFGHYINDRKFIEAVCSGKKEDKTDPHSLNARILGCTRDSAKTFIFAFLLGMGDRKAGEILGLDTEGGRKKKQIFVESYPGLVRLKQNTIPKDAKRGYMQAIDGRLIACDSEHHMMAVYLQSSEAILMKHANVLWRHWLDKEKIWYKQVAWCHDEWVTEVNKEEAEYIGKLQSRAIKETGERFKLNCPMSGEYKIGKNWLQAH